MLRSIRDDLRFSIRYMRADLAFSLTALLLVGGAIAVGTVVFSLVHPFLTGTLPFREAGRLVALTQTHPQWGDGLTVSLPNFLDWRRLDEVFEEVAAYAERPLTVESGSGPERLWSAETSFNLFPMLGAKPYIGHLFNRKDDSPKAPPVVLLSYGLWQRRFGGDASVVGRILHLDNETAVVVGVMPRGFRFPLRPAAETVDLWTAMPEDPAVRTRESLFLRVVARLRDKVSLHQAQGRLSILMEEINRTVPEEEAFGARATLWGEEETGDLRPAMAIFSSAVALLLLTACINLSGLILARGVARQSELALRHALGATRWRLTRQLLTEALLLSLLGGALGAVASHWVLRLLSPYVPDRFRLSDALRLDLDALLFALFASVLCGLVMGAIPAWPASRPVVVEALSRQARNPSATVARHRLGRVLVASEVALAVVLMTGSGLLIKSFWQLLQVERGFDSRHVVTARLWLPEDRYGSPEQCLAFFERLGGEVEARHALVAFGAIQSIPIGTDRWQTYLDVEGREFPTGKAPVADFRVVWGDYLRALSIPILRGRAFGDEDRAGAPPVAIVNESLASRLWPGQEALGKRLHAVGAEGPGGWETVVGVVEDVTGSGLRRKPQPAIYRPYLQFPVPNMALVAKLDGEMELVTTELQETISRLDRSVPALRPRPLADLVSASLADDRYGMVLLTVFAAAALTLGLLGIYSVTSFSVRQSRREIGIRTALGAEAPDIVRLFLVRGAVVAGVGLTLGLGAAFVFAGAVGSLLFGVSPRDPSIFGTVGLLSALACGFACYLPSRRAARVDPSEVLRAL